MNDFSKEIVNLLSPILPTYLELFVDKSITTPCITYLPLSNVMREHGDFGSNSIIYDYPVYTIKVWGDIMEDLMEYAEDIDEAMYNYGFERQSFRPLTYDGHIQIIMDYGALAKNK